MVFTYSTSSSNNTGISIYSDGIYSGTPVSESYTANNTPGGIGPLNPTFSFEAPFSTIACTSRIIFFEKGSFFFNFSSRRFKARK